MSERRAEASADVRILARWLDDPDACSLSLDARIDDATRRIVGGWTIFGAVHLDSPECRPFALSGDGAMDFGAAAPPSERRWRSDIRQRRIGVGEAFLVTWPGGDQGEFVIERVSRLGAKSIA